jgi:predicted DCC family thiol-disulfide oxidoreductase YuxK
MWIKVFGSSSDTRYGRVCSKVEEVVATARADSALSMSFMDLDSKTGKKQANQHGIKRKGSIVITTDGGQELGRCDDVSKIENLLDELRDSPEK